VKNSQLDKETKK